jgi:hypothetical protein
MQRIGCETTARKILQSIKGLEIWEINKSYVFFEIKITLRKNHIINI